MLVYEPFEFSRQFVMHTLPLPDPRAVNLYPFCINVFALFAFNPGPVICMCPKIGPQMLIADAVNAAP